MAPLFAEAKPITQEGIAYLYNYKTKSKRPLAGVSFTVADAQPTKSNANGEFTLHFMTLKKGSKITNVRQPFFKGLKVFNKKTVDDWYIINDKLELIMCDYEEFELVKKTYYEQGKKSAEKKYSRKIRELEEALRKGKLREEEYEQMLQEERENHQKVLDNLNNSADEMARIDQSEISKQMQDVYRLYEQGEVDKAMEMLARLHLVEGLDQAKIRKERSRKEYQEAVQDSIRAVRNIRSAISLYNYNGDTKNEEILRRTLANRTQTPLELFEYACFCYGVKEYQDSVVPCYKRVMEMTKDSRHHLLSHLYLYATSAYNIGVWYQSRKQIEIANKYLEIGIEERKKYAKQSSNPNDEGHVAWALTGKASGETSNGLFSDAWQHLSEAQEIYDRIVALNPDEHYWALGRLYAYYGDWYRKQGKNEKAEKEYVKAMSIFKEYIDMQPAEYPSYVKYSFDSMVTWLQPTVATLAKHKKFEDV